MTELVHFIIPDSLVDEESSHEGWDLITGLPALRDLPETREKEHLIESHEVKRTSFTMSGDKNEEKIAHKLFGSAESEVEQGQPVHLATDTASYDNGSTSKSDSGKEVTVIERVVSASEDEEDADGRTISTPAGHIGSLHLSAEPFYVPETMDSFDEVGASPDAYGSFPQIIPDSPTEVHVQPDSEKKKEVDSEDDDDDVITFKPITQRMESFPLSVDNQESQRKSDSQSLHLRLSPSQLEPSQSKGPEQRKDDPIIVSLSKTGKESTALEMTERSEGTEDSLPSFHLQRPSTPVETHEETEESISVFKRVKSGLTTPLKQQKIIDDSEDILERRTVRNVKLNTKTLTSNEKQTDLFGIAESISSLQGNPGVNSPSSKDKSKDRHVYKESAIEDDSGNNNAVTRVSPAESYDFTKLDTKKASNVSGSSFLVEERFKPKLFHGDEAEQVTVIEVDNSASQAWDEEQTMPYELPTDRNLDRKASGKRVSHEEETGSEINVCVITSSDDAINPSQNPSRSTLSRISATTVLEGQYHGFEGFDVASTLHKDSTSSKKNEDGGKSLRDKLSDRTKSHVQSGDSSFPVSLPEDATISEGKKAVSAGKSKNTKEVQQSRQGPASTPTTASPVSGIKTSEVVRERSVTSKALEHCTEKTRGQIKNAFPSTSKLVSSTEQEEGRVEITSQDSMLKTTDKPHQPSCLEGDIHMSHQGASEPATSKHRSQMLSESSTLGGPPRSLDPYVFVDSQSMNVGDVSALPHTSRTQTGPEVKKVKRVVKKVLKKKAPAKLQRAQSSSTEDALLETRSGRTVSRPKGFVTKRKRQQQQPSKEISEQPGPSTVTPHLAQVSESSFTVVQAKSQFSRPQDPPPLKVATSSRTDPAGSETLQIRPEDQTHGGDASRLRKPTTVSFSHEIVVEPGSVVKESSDNSEPEIEKTTIRRMIYSVVTVVLETRTEVINSKGSLVRQSENSEVVSRTEFKPEILSEDISTRIIPEVTSPSRSTSTMTTGDLADISSSSMSRTNSTGSKISNPSLELAPLSQGLPTPAQRSRSMDGQEKGTQLPARSPDMPVATVVGASTKADNKRLSSGSNTGLDLFGTPNQSIIEKADSQLGKVVSSSNSTPGSHPTVSPSGAHTKGTVSKDVPQKEKSFSRTKQDIFVSGAEQELYHTAPVATEIPEYVSPENRKEHQPISDETPQKQSIQQPTSGKRLLKTSSLSSDGDSQPDLPITLKRQCIEAKSSQSKASPAKLRHSLRKTAESRKENYGESTDVQSTGFSVATVTTSTVSPRGLRTPITDTVASSRSGSGLSSQVSLQGGLFGDSFKTVVITDYKSRVEEGAMVMAKWKDGFYYSGTLSNVDHNSKKYLVKYDDGTQRVSKPAEIILACNLPVGQSVMVLRGDGFYEPGMVMGHCEDQAEDQPHLLYYVERDDGVRQKCQRASLMLSEDQAAILLSDEEFRISPETVARSASKPGDISLDNLVEGKRSLRKKTDSASKSEQPSTSGMQSAQTSSVGKDHQPGSASTRSGQKRKLVPVATSTPTPKLVCKERKDRGTPKKSTALNLLGGVVASPSDSRRSPRKARVGLFESTLTSKSKIFEGAVFMLTHIDKSAELRAKEKRLLQDSSLDTSADDNTDIEPESAPFNKERIQAAIEMGGGTVINSYDEEVIQSADQCYLVASEHQRTVKYLQALAGGMTIVSHQWILESASQNRLQGLKAYILPAGISLEKRKLMERVKGCKPMIDLTVMVISTHQDFINTWKTILSITECHIVSRFPARANKNDPGVDVVVSDATCPPSVVSRCRQLEVPLVSSEWVAQCLINGQLVSVTGHEMYKHDFSA